jgi:hypothetical protein
MDAHTNCANWTIPDQLRVIMDANVRDDVYRNAEQAIVEDGESVRPSLEQLTKSSD